MPFDSRGSSGSAGAQGPQGATGATGAAGATAYATQTEQETGTAEDRVVTPGKQKSHPSAAKFWVKAGTTGNILASFGVSSVTDVGPGILGITFSTAFSSAHYAVSAQVEASEFYGVSNTRRAFVKNATQLAGSVQLDCLNTAPTTNALADPNFWHSAGFGDQ